MEAAMSNNRRRGAQVICLVPSDVVSESDRRLRSFLAVAHGIDLMVERRWRERRRQQRRASSPGAVGNARRVVRNQHGRRVADRRGALVEVAGPALPESLNGARSRVRFARHEPLSPRAALSARSLRLVVRFQAGDQEAFVELYDQWTGRLWDFFAQRLRDHHAAEDAMQKIAASLLSDLRDFEIRPDVPFEAWLFRIAHCRLCGRAAAWGAGVGARAKRGPRAARARGRAAGAL
jgi:hypothetical protein